MKFARTTFTLDAKALSAARASDVLAIDPRSFGSTLALRAAAPSSDWLPVGGAAAPIPRVGMVEVFGPIAHRGSDDLCGFVDGYDTIERRFTRALADDELDAVVLVIDSPGGDVAGMAEAVGRMRAAAAASGKPVYAFADEQACSAAYAIATVAEKIFMPPSGVTGSIGTACIHADQSAALESEGVKVTIVRSGDRKMEGGPLEPLTPEARNAYQAKVNAAATQFASIVAEARGGNAARWLALEGRSVLAPEALELGLVDGVKSLDDVIDLAAAAALERNDMKTEQQAKGMTAEDATALEVGKVAVALTGAATSEAAIKQIRGWQSGAARAEVYDAERAQREATEKAAAEKAENGERVELVRGMVARGVLPPAKAWLPSEEHGPRAENGVAEPWASMKMKTLRATAGAVEGPVGSSIIKPDPSRVAQLSGSGSRGDDDDKAAAARAKAAGVSEASLAAARNLNLSGTGRVEIS